MAPEIVLGLEYSSKVDVFSYGILMYAVLTERFRPYNEENDPSDQFVQFKVANDPKFRPDISYIRSKGKKKLAPVWMVELMQKCWRANPSARPSFTKIMAILSAKSKRKRKGAQKSHHGKGKLLLYIKLEDMKDEEAIDCILTDMSFKGLLRMVRMSGIAENMDGEPPAHSFATFKVNFDVYKIQKNGDRLEICDDLHVNTDLEKDDLLIIVKKTEDDETDEATDEQSDTSGAVADQPSAPEASINESSAAKDEGTSSAGTQEGKGAAAEGESDAKSEEARTEVKVLDIPSSDASEAAIVDAKAGTGDSTSSEKSPSSGDSDG